MRQTLGGQNVNWGRPEWGKLAWGATAVLTTHTAVGGSKC